MLCDSKIWYEEGVSKQSDAEYVQIWIETGMGKSHAITLVFSE